MINSQPVPELAQSKRTLPMTILLAYDGSEHAQAAVQFLRDIPIGSSSIHLLAVMPTQYFQNHEGLQVAMDLARVRLERSGLCVKSELKVGNPAVTINNYAEEHQVDLIVMGAKGLRATLGILLGGVAQSVVEYSNCPVLIVRAPYRQVKNILLVTDGSESGQAAIEYLAPHCDTNQPHRRCFWLPEDAYVQVMHVLPPPLSPDIAARAWTLGPEVLFPGPLQPIEIQDLEAEENRAGEQILARSLKILDAAGVAAHGILDRGDAATQIIEHVQKHNIDLIVCGSRGLNPVTGWLLGSVSRKLVHYAGCSVLVVKTRRM